MTIDESTSATLLGQLWDPQNDAAWRRFVERYRPLIERRCLSARLQEADAQEIAQQVLVKLAQLMPTFQYDPERSFRGWLKTVVDNKVKDMWRKAARQLDAPLGGTAAQQEVRNAADHRNLMDDTDGLVDTLNSALDRDVKMLRRAMQAVEQRVEATTWQAFARSKLEGESGDQIAEALQMNIAAVYKAVSRIFKMLKEEVSLLQSSDPTQTL